MIIRCTIFDDDGKMVHIREWKRPYKICSKSKKIKSKLKEDFDTLTRWILMEYTK
jgi:hypothetical protein